MIFCCLKIIEKSSKWKDGVENEDKRLVIDYATKDVIVRTFDLYYNGYSYQKISNLFNEEKLNITDCTEKLKFTPKDILLKRDIDFINKIKLDKEYQEKTKTWKDYTREEKADLIMRYVEDIELTLVGSEVILKQINFRDSNGQVLYTIPKRAMKNLILC